MISFAEFNRRLEKYQRSAPVKLMPLAEELGIRVYDVDGWPDDISGRIFRSEERGGESGFAIELNNNHSRNRRRFTLAHELAHYALHQDDIGSGGGIYDDAMYRSGLQNYKEAHANRVAAQILMPEALLVKAYADIGSDVRVLAALFEVSPKAMSVRLGVLLPE